VATRRRASVGAVGRSAGPGPGTDRGAHSDCGAVGNPGNPGRGSDSGPLGGPGGPRPGDLGALGPIGLGAPGAASGAKGAGAVGEDGESDPEAVARQICLRMLTAAPKTRAQLAAALRRRGVPDEAAEAVLGRFADVKLIDDAMFANAWVESRHYSRGLSGRALAAELRHRGVAAEDIRAAVDRLGPEQEIATARSLVARRLAATRGQPTPARVRRLIGVLARKGYSQALAYRVAREALEQEGVDLAAAGVDLTEAPDEAGEDVPAGRLLEP
jgi:regulatory protein